MSGAEEIARTVDAAAAGVEGVARVYSAAPVVVGLVRAALPATDAPLTLVRGSDPVDVVVSIGVDAEGAGGEVAQRVADAVRGAVGADAIVHVRVSRVHASTPA